MRKKIEGYAYLDDKDVCPDAVLENIFDDMEFTFGKPSHEAVGFIQGYPFYATYSDCSNELLLNSFNKLEDYQMDAIEDFLKHDCDDEQYLKVEVETYYKQFRMLFYFKNVD